MHPQKKAIVSVLQLVTGKNRDWNQKILIFASIGWQQDPVQLANVQAVQTIKTRILYSNSTLDASFRLDCQIGEELLGAGTPAALYGKGSGVVP